MWSPAAWSIAGVANSAASSSPLSSIALSLEAGASTNIVPNYSITGPPIPSILILNPFKSDTLLIGLANQPPICIPVSPAGSGTRLWGAYNSSHSWEPPPNDTHAANSLELNPNGIEAKNVAPGYKLLQ